MDQELTAPASEEVAEKSLREELQSAFDESKQPAEPEEATPAASSRARDESGRFAKSEEKTETAPAAQATPQAAQSPAAAPAAQAEVPVAWRSEANQKIWAALSPEVQKAISQREAEVHKGFTKFDDERNFGKSIRDVVNPYLPMIQAEGGNPVAAVQNLLNTAYILRNAPAEQKVQALQRIAQTYGISLENVVQQRQNPVDPQYESLQQRLARLETERQQETQQRQYQQQQELTSQITAFAASPDHPHFETVKTHMGTLLQNGLATSMQDAYDQAVWSRPDLRSAMLAAQQAAEQSKRQADAAAKASAARAASGSVRGNPAGAVANNGSPDRSLRDEIRASLRGAAA